MSLKNLLTNLPFHLALIALLGLLAYSNTFDVPFQWDEEHFIVENPIVKDPGYFIEPSKAKGFEQYGAFKNRYIGYLTFALNYKIHGLDVTGYHIFNLAVHILNALLVYFLVVLTMRTPFLSNPPSSPLKLRGDSRRPMGGGLFTGGQEGGTIALFSALLFVSHPIQTEAVTYIFQRFASLAAFFYLLSLVLYVKWRLSSLGHSGLSGISLRKDSRQAGMTARQSILYLLSLLSALLAMKTKENAFTLPVMIALYEFFFFRGPIKRRALYLIPFILTMLIIPLTLIGVDKPLGEIIGGVGPAMGGSGKISRWDYLFTQFSVVVTYIRLLLLPVNQNIDYDYPVFRTFFNPQVVLSFLFLLSVFCLGAYLLYRSLLKPHLRLVSFGIFWFFITLSVESSIIPIPMVIDEYRLYLPSVGFLLGVIVIFLFSMSSRNRKSAKIAVTALSLIIYLFSMGAYVRNKVWESRISLWEDVVIKSPQKAIGYIMLGYAYASLGDADKSIAYYQDALKREPYSQTAHNLLGLAYYDRGRIDKAIGHYQVVLMLNPNSAVAHNNLGTAYRRAGLPEKALEHFQNASRLNPAFAEAHCNLGMALSDRGMVDEAIEHYRIALKIKPDFIEALIGIGNIHFREGNIDEALRHYTAAVGLQPGNALLHDNLGVLYLKKGFTDKAEEYFMKAKTIKDSSKK